VHAQVQASADLQLAARIDGITLFLGVEPVLTVG
jgi:hypothetical protein